MEAKANWLKPLSGSSLDDWWPVTVYKPLEGERRIRKMLWVREWRRKKRLEMAKKNGRLDKS